MPSTTIPMRQKKILKENTKRNLLVKRNSSNIEFLNKIPTNFMATKTARKRILNGKRPLN